MRVGTIILEFTSRNAQKKFIFHPQKLFCLFYLTTLTIHPTSHCLFSQVLALAYQKCSPYYRIKAYFSYFSYLIFLFIHIRFFNIRVKLQTQTILQHFYKLLMWQILTSFNMGPLLTSHFYLQ